MPVDEKTCWLFLVTGDIKDAQECITGVDYIAGQKLTGLDRAASGMAMFVPFGSGGTIRVALDNVKLTKYIKKCNAAYKGGSGSVDDIISGLKETTNGKGVARNFESTGGYEQTLKDFENLKPTDVKEIQTQYGTGKVGTLSDGTKVVARQGSKTGGATLEIKISNSKVYKIRY